MEDVIGKEVMTLSLLSNWVLKQASSNSDMDSLFEFNSWLEKVDKKIESTWFYTDSYNDLPLLEHVTNPVVVDADQRLSEHANKKGWQKISLR